MRGGTSCLPKQPTRHQATNQVSDGIMHSAFAAQIASTIHLGFGLSSRSFQEASFRQIALHLVNCSSQTRFLLFAAFRRTGPVDLRCADLSTERRKDQLRATIAESSPKEGHRLTYCQASAVQSGSPPGEVRHGIHLVIKAVQEAKACTQSRGKEQFNRSTPVQHHKEKRKKKSKYAQLNPSAVMPSHKKKFI
jgi:hypothetical protein